MMNFRKLSMTLGAVGAMFAASYSNLAWAQATRTWVSGVGSDANPCSRTAPCQTFAGAISKTATGGEINCLDPGGFGGLTITKRISIVCDYTEGGVLSAGAGVNGFVINLPAVTDAVFLSGLDFNGAGSAQNGIRIITGGIVHVRNTIIRNYRASNGRGMSIQPAGALQLFIDNTTIADNGTGATGGGILVQPTGAGGTARIEMRNVRVTGNANQGLRVDTTGNTGFGILMDVESSQFSGSPTGISTNTPSSSFQMVLNRSNISNNTTGMNHNGANNRSRVGDTTITNNGTGLTITGGAIINSFGTNRLDGNGVDGAFTPPIINPE